MNSGPPISDAGDPAGDGLVNLFAAGRFEFQMRMRRQEIAEYFRPSPDAAFVLEERRRWLCEEPAQCFAFEPEAEELADEAAALLSVDGGSSGSPAMLSMEARGRFFEMSRQLEPDLVLLRSDSKGDFSMVAGSVCFPSSWSLTEKMGRSIGEIHAPVPTLNESLGPTISKFLLRMGHGVAWCRENWGLSASPELNQHPARLLPKLTQSVALEKVWLRVERQALVALPGSGGVLFAIRVETTPLCEIVGQAGCRAGLRRALETMPGPVAVYKGLDAARDRLIELLR